MNEVAVNERPSSIEVSENAKKQFSYKVKVYYDEDYLAVVEQIENIYKELYKRFK